MSVAKGWGRLVQHYAEQAARDPARRAARLEAPPHFPGAHANLKWHAAELAYRQQLQQLESQADREAEADGRVWWMIARFIYSGNMIGLLIAAGLAFGILRWMGVL